MFQIDFFDEDLLHTLVPIHTLRPDAVCFLADKRKITDRRLALAGNALRRWNAAMDISDVDVDPDSLADIRAALERVLSARPAGEEIYIDLTGGSELLVIAGYEICSKYGAIPVYMDSAREHLLDVRTGEALMSIRHIGISDYLTAIGAKALPHSHALPNPADGPAICRVAEAFFKNTKKWQALYDYITTYYARRYAPRSPFIHISNSFVHRNGLSRIMNILLDEGFLVSQGRSDYVFRDETIRSYLSVYGVWLELYIYIKALEFFDTSSLGIVVDWDGTDALDRVDNEFDVIAMHRSAPLFISCKMCMPCTDDVYEVASLAARFGGSSARACIATTMPLHNNARQMNSIFHRIDKMHVGLIETGDFATKSTEEIFRGVLQATDETGVP